MAELSRADLKLLFQSNDVPTEDDYESLIDSVKNVSEDTDDFTDLGDTPSTLVGNGGKHVKVNAVETALEFVDGLNKKVLDIGDWDMDTDTTVDVLHGLDHTKIRSMSVTIRDDDEGWVWDLSSNVPASDVLVNGTSRIFANSTIVRLIRGTDGYFDNDDFSATSFNRGWIVIEYAD